MPTFALCQFDCWSIWSISATHLRFNNFFVREYDPWDIKSVRIQKKLKTTQKCNFEVFGGLETAIRSLGGVKNMPSGFWGVS